MCRRTLKNEYIWVMTCINVPSSNFQCVAINVINFSVIFVTYPIQKCTEILSIIFRWLQLPQSVGTSLFVPEHFDQVSENHIDHIVNTHLQFALTVANKFSRITPVIILLLIVYINHNIVKFLPSANKLNSNDYDIIT